MTRKHMLGGDNVTVILNGTQEDGLSYDIIIHPPAPIRLRVSNSFELKVAYNTSYNVSVVPSFCGEKGAAEIFNLHFGKFAYSDSCSLIILSAQI